MLVLGIDGGRKPGYAYPWAGCWQLRTKLRLPAQPLHTFEIAGVEDQYVPANGRAQRDGRKFKVSPRNALQLAFRAGPQLWAVPAKRKLKLPHDVWCGMLWPDGGNRLAKVAVLARLRDCTPGQLGLAMTAFSVPLAEASDDEVEALGIAAALLRIGHAKEGKLLDGQRWVAKNRGWWHDIEIDKPAKRARAFVKGLLQ